MVRSSRCQTCQRRRSAAAADCNCNGEQSLLFSVSDLVVVDICTLCSFQIASRSLKWYRFVDSFLGQDGS